MLSGDHSPSLSVAAACSSILGLCQRSSHKRPKRLATLVSIRSREQYMPATSYTLSRNAQCWESCMHTAA